MSTVVRHDFEKRLDRALSTPVSPENIDGYVDAALEQVIAVVNDTVDAYDAVQPATPTDTNLGREDAALTHFGLTSVPQTLDHLQEKSEQLQKIDRLIMRSSQVEVVFVPTQEGQKITRGNGTFEEKKQLNRLKTVLFVLENEFDIDTTDSEQVDIMIGSVTSDMVRQTPYVSLDIKSLGRNVLICDEEGNVSYVFNSEDLAGMGIDVDALVRMEKPELNNLLEQNPGSGRRINYSTKFVNNLIKALQNPAQPVRRQSSYLRPDQCHVPQAPEKYLSVVKLAKRWGIGQQAIHRIIAELREEDAYGPEELYRFGPNGSGSAGLGISPQQQEFIRQRAEAKDLFIDDAPEGFLTATALANELGITNSSVYKIIQELQDEGRMLDIAKHRHGPRAYPSLSPEQQAIITDQARKKGLFAGNPPEGYKSIGQLSRDSTVGRESLERIINELIAEDSMGEVARHRHGSAARDSYSPEQQALILSRAQAQHLLVDRAPDDFLSLKALADDLGADFNTVRKIAEELEAEGTLGEVAVYRHGNQPRASYSPEQQDLVRMKMTEKYGSGPSIPEGFITPMEMSRRLGISQGTIDNIVSELSGSEAFGDVGIYFASNRRQLRYLSPAQQALARQLAEQKGLLVEQIPEDYVSVAKYAKLMGIGQMGMDSILKKLEDDESFGEVELFRIHTVLGRTLSPAQQEKVRIVAAEQHMFAQQAPEDYRTIKGLADDLGVHSATVAKAIQKLEEAGLLGEVVMHIHGPRAFPSLSPQQQEIIARQLGMM